MCACTGGCGEETASARGAPDPSALASVEDASAAAPGALSAAPVASSPPVDPYEAETLAEMDFMGATIEEQRAAVLRRMRASGLIDDAASQAIAAIFQQSKMAGQGNPESTTHPLTRAECFARRAAAGVRDEKQPVCRAPYMVPVFDPRSQSKDQAKLCIDRYEFPGLPCEYPITWITTAEAQSICRAMGKRLCDAHEWEGACAGALRKPEEEYRFDTPRISSSGLHNIDREILWAYGPTKSHETCGTMSAKSPKCAAPSWKDCGSNTYPAGSFPACKSPFGVYDQHGNAAEHMALPLRADQLGVDGGFGDPEMKGSWFVFSSHEAHLDDCRWRAPPWHADEGKNHSNYHLGFRCCKDVAPR